MARGMFYATVASLISGRPTPPCVVSSPVQTVAELIVQRLLHEHMLPWFAHAAINALVVAYVCRHVVSLVAFLCVGTLEIHVQQFLILRKCRHDSMRQL